METKVKPWAVIWSFWLYTIIWDGGIMAAFLYWTIWAGHSMWFMVVALILCGSSYKPWHWHALLTGVKPVDNDEDED